MSTLTDTPHTVTLKRPARPRAAATNSTTLDYSNPSVNKSITGMFQSRGGIKAISGEGEAIPFDAMFFTLETDVQADDLFEVALTWAAGNYIVASVEPKPDLDGIFDHTEVFLQKGTKL